MTATTDILPFATGVGANVETQSAYAADSATTNGFSSGVATSAKLNKVWRQSSFIAAGVANWMVSQGVSVPDDGNLSNLVTEITSAFTAFVSTISSGGYYYGSTTGGTANAQTLATVTPSGYTLGRGNAVAFTAGVTNTGATTLSVASTTATAVKIDTGSGLAALTGGEIVNGNDYVVYYDGTQYVLIDPSTLAFLNSPALTGTPTAPTASFGTNTTQLATTAFVHAALSTPNFYANAPSAPTGTSSATPVMMGLAGAITPNFSGVVEFTVTGVALQSGSPGTIGIQMYYGTGTAPTNGASPTGTAIGALLQPNLVSQATEGSGFSVNYIVSGLTSGTTYWFDLGLSNSAGNTSNVKNLTVVAKELK